MPFKPKSCKSLPFAAILFGSLFISTACAQPTPPEPTSPPPVVAPTLASGQSAFTIPRPEGITQSKNHKTPGVGFSATYNAPALDETAVQAYFNATMPQLGFTPLGKIDPT